MLMKTCYCYLGVGGQAMPIITADPLLDVRTEMLFDPTKDATMDGELIDDLMSSESKIFAISKEHNIYKGPVFG